MRFHVFSVDDVVFIILAVNLEKHDQEQSEKEKDLNGPALGKNEKELLVIGNLSFQVYNILVITLWSFVTRFNL